MGAIKWITGALGWAIFGPLGGILGFFIGSALDGSVERARLNAGSGNDYGYSNGNDGYSGGYGGEYDANSQRNSFLLSLLVLCSVVMRADGRVMRSELKYVQDFLRSNFGEGAVLEGSQILKELLKKEVNVYQVSAQIKAYTNIAERRQLLHLLVGLANADGNIDSAERSVLCTIASCLGLSQADVDSFMAMFGQDFKVEDAYKVLEIEPSASDDEVKRAYRRMAAKNHPDKVASLGADVQATAAEKFKKITEAYEKIKKERGIA